MSGQTHAYFSCSLTCCSGYFKYPFQNCQSTDQHSLPKELRKLIKYILDVITSIKQPESSEANHSFALFVLIIDCCACLLHIVGTAGDSLTRQKGMQFSTKDRDNDVAPSSACTQTYKGAWWCETCEDSNLNGPYSSSASVPNQEGIIWKSWKGYYYSLMKIAMRIRPQ